MKARLAIFLICGIIILLTGCGSSGSSNPDVSSVQSPSSVESSSSVAMSSQISSMPESSEVIPSSEQPSQENEDDNPALNPVPDSSVSPLSRTLSEYLETLDESLASVGLPRLSDIKPEVTTKSEDFGKMLEYDFNVTKHVSVVIETEPDTNRVIRIMSALTKKGATTNEGILSGFFSGYNIGYFASDNMKRVEEQLGFNKVVNKQTTVALQNCVFSYINDSEETALLVSAIVQ